MEIKGTRVIVTGGAGFIGSHLTDKLVELGAHVTVIDNLSFGSKENINNEANFLQVDVCDYLTMKDIISSFKPDLVFHLAANATTKETSMGWSDPASDYLTNAGGTLNVLKAVADTSKNTHVIFTSSAAVYGEPEYVPIDENHPTNPISPYGVSKLAGEKYCFAYFKELDIKTTILRIFNTYGPRQPRYVMFDLLKKLEKNPDQLEVIGTGEQVRDYCYVSDTVSAFILAAQKNGFGKIFNVAGGNPISISDLSKLIIKSLGLSKRTSVYYTGKSWTGDIMRLSASITKIQEALGFNPLVKLEDGILKLRDSVYPQSGS